MFGFVHPKIQILSDFVEFTKPLVFLSKNIEKIEKKFKKIREYINDCNMKFQLHFN
jgi:hypothetical protein